MKVILLQDVKAIGQKGDLAEVNDGYAKNFLIPKKLAAEANKTMVNEYKQRIAKEARIKEQEKQTAMELKGILAKKVLDVAVKCGDGKMYGSVTTQDIANALAKDGIEIDKKKITIPESIRQLGTHTVEVWLYKETTVKLQINVVKA